MYRYGNNESIAEMNIFENLINITYIIKDFMSILNNIIENISRDDTSVEIIYSKIIEPKHRIQENKIMFMEYLVRLGESLPMKEHYVSIVLGLERLSQYIDGAAYRLTLLKRSGNPPKELLNYLSELYKILNEQLDNFIDGLKKIRVEPKKTIDYVNNVLKLEDKADELYREASYSIYSMLSDRIILLMVMRDILDFLEDSSDLMRSLGEELRYLALHKIMIS